MRIVIDIPKTAYEYFTQGLRYTDDVEMAIIAIVNGTSLPKGHGKLIDADEVKRKMGNLDGFGMIGRCIDEFPTIVEADMEESDG